MPKTILDTNAKKATAYLFRLTKDVRWETLSKMAHNPEISLNYSLSRMGLVHPLSMLGVAPEDTVLEAFPNGYVTTLRWDQSVITSTAIKQASASVIAKRMKELPEHESLSRDERSAITEAVRGELLKSAPEVTKYIPIIIDTASDRILIMDTSERVLSTVLSYINNAFAGDITVFALPQLARKAGVEKLGEHLLSRLSLIHRCEAAAVTETAFAQSPNLTLGSGVKLCKIDGEQGHSANLSGIELTDPSLYPMIERAGTLERIGMLLMHQRSDVDFQLNSKLQLTKVDLRSILADGQTEDQEEEDVVAQLRATALLITDVMESLLSNVAGFVGFPYSLDLMPSLVGQQTTISTADFAPAAGETEEVADDAEEEDAVEA